MCAFEVEVDGTYTTYRAVGAQAVEVEGAECGCGAERRCEVVGTLRTCKAVVCANAVEADGTWMAYGAVRAQVVELGGTKCGCRTRRSCAVEVADTQRRTCKAVCALEVEVDGTYTTYRAVGAQAVEVGGSVRVRR